MGSTNTTCRRAVRNLGIASAFSLFAAVAAGCGSGSETSEKTVNGPGSPASTLAIADLARDPLVDAMRGRFETGQRSCWPASLAEALPGSGSDCEAGDGLVSGVLSPATEGSAFRDHAEGSRPTDWDDPDADWRSFHLDLTVEDVLRGKLDSGTVPIGFTTGPNINLDQVQHSLSEIFGSQRVIVFLNSQSSVFAYASGRSAISADGLLILRETSSGTLEAPLLPPAESERLFGEDVRLPDLR
jgi:hypothetical protein